MKFKVGEKYEVHFYDHSTGDESDIIARILGWYVDETEMCYRFTSWEVLTEDIKFKSDNYECANILKSQIIKRIKL